MKIGVFLGNYDPINGGAYKLTEEIVRILSTMKSDCQFVFLYENERKNIKVADSIVYINILDKFSADKRDFFSTLKFRMTRSIVTCINNKMRLFQKEKNNNPKTQKPSTFLLNIVNCIYNASKSYLLNQQIEKIDLDCIWLTYPCELNLEIPYLITVFDLAHRQIPYFPEIQKSGWSWDARERLYSKMLPKASIILTGNKTGADDISFYYRIPKENIQILNFPTPVYDNVDKSDKIGNDYQFVFYPAQYWPHKNHVLIINAIRILKDKYSLELNAVFCGSDKGNKDFLISHSKSLGVYNQIKFLGFIEDNDIVELYKKAVALTYVSYLGPNNLPPQEAVKFGCPVIISDLPGHREQMQNAAIFVSLTNPDILAEAIYRLYSNQDDRKLIIEEGSKLLYDYCDNIFVEKLKIILNEFKNKLATFDRNGNYQ